MKTLSKIFVVPLLVLLFGLSLTPSLAQEPNPVDEFRSQQAGQNGLRGEVTAISGSDLTLLTPAYGQVTVTTTDETRLFVAGAGAGELADVEIGSLVIARGERTSDTSLTARLLLVIPPELRAKAKLWGRISSVEGSIIKMENARGQTGEIVTTAATPIRLNGEAASLSDLSQGSMVIGFGQRTGKTLTAELVISFRGPLANRAMAAGQVTAVNGDSFTLDTPRRGEVTVQTDENSTFRNRDGDILSLADVTVGKRVMVIGRQVEGAEKSIQAFLVGIGEE